MANKLNLCYQFNAPALTERKQNVELCLYPDWVGINTNKNRSLGNPVILKHVILCN